MPDDLVDQYRVVPLPAGNGAYIINSSPIAAAEPDVDVTMNISHLKPSKHPDSMMNIAGYTLFRRDRPRRRGGGVAIYIGANPHTVAREVQPVKLRPCV